MPNYNDNYNGFGFMTNSDYNESIDSVSSSNLSESSDMSSNYSANSSNSTNSSYVSNSNATILEHANLIKSQSTQMLSLVDIINEYTKQTTKLNGENKTLTLQNIQNESNQTLLNDRITSLQKQNTIQLLILIFLVCIILFLYKRCDF